MTHKIVFCRDCGRDETVPGNMSEPWVCDKCFEKHKAEASKDAKLEAELNGEER